MRTSNTLTIRVFDVQRRPIETAQVKLKESGEVQRRARGIFAARGVMPGRLQLQASAPGLQPESRTVEVGEATRRVDVILGAPGLPAYTKGGVRVPYEPQPGLIALRLRRAAKGDSPLRAAQMAAVTPVLQGLQTQLRRHEGSGLDVLQVPADQLGAIVDKLRALKEVHSAGPLAWHSARSLAYFTGGILLRLRGPAKADEVEALAAKAGAKLSRKLLPASMWLLAAGGDDAQTLNACETLAGLPGVASAEPELAFTSETDAITPTDELADAQWHLATATFPEAWQRLRDANPPGVNPGDAGDLTFGSADVVIAVIDQGVESEDDGAGNIVARHVEFRGNVSNGLPKMAGFFDFGAMVANNNNPLGAHGIQCAGVAAAPANNASTVAGEEEGISGGAPNCRLLAVQIPNAGTEAEFSDIYLWMAGLDAGNPDPDFPAQLAQGAQVITNSAGGLNPAAFPVSDLMNETFETLTDTARNGRGTLMFFSAGNADMEFAAQRPWANHARTFGVAASNEAERKADYSNFGDGIDFCAPSSDNSPTLRDITTTFTPGAGTLPGHTGGPDDYVDDFGGTSSATPLSAALGALILSVDPTLTWQEARDILCRTARKIDFANTDADGQWRDRDGDGTIEYSNWYGHGRIDAAKAVCVARTVIELTTPSVDFIDVPEDEPTLRAVGFNVRSHRTLHFEVTAGPTTTTGPANTFVLHAGSTAQHTGNFDCVASQPRIWLRFTGTDAGDAFHGSITVRCIETNQSFVVPIHANVIERPRAALVLAMDRSGSMNANAGDGRKRIEVLRDSAIVVPALAEEDTGLGAVAWDTDADLAGAMAVTDAGLEAIGAGRIALNAKVANHQTNINGMTAIGDAVLAAQSLLDDASPDYAVKAMVVLTDGQETESLYLSELPAGAIGANVFAIGLGTAEEIQPNALATLTAGRQGYLLMTGAMTADDYFLLAKYYQQILAGVTNSEIVVDPDGYLAPGQRLRLPFHINETDWRFDAVLHSPLPGAIRYWLEAPDGQRVDPGTLAGEPRSRFVATERSHYYRMHLPISKIGPQDPGRPWHAVLELDDKGWKRYLGQLDKHPEEYRRAAAHGLRYAFVVQARSTLGFTPAIAQASHEPGASAQLRARITEFGFPPPRGARVRAEVMRPDRSTFKLELAEGGDGEFAAAFTAAQSGVYRVHFLAEGRTTRGSAWSREGLRSVVTWRGGDRPPPEPKTPNGDAHGSLCDWLQCLLSTRAIDPKRLQEWGIDLKALRKCACSKPRRVRGEIGIARQLLGAKKR